MGERLMGTEIVIGEKVGEQCDGRIIIGGEIPAKD